MLLVAHLTVARELDIHIEVQEETFFAAITQQLATLLPNNEINFITTDLPHVTLYLTQFEDNLIPSVINGYLNPIKLII